MAMIKEEIVVNATMMLFGIIFLVKSRVLLINSPKMTATCSLVGTWTHEESAAALRSNMTRTMIMSTTSLWKTFKKIWIIEYWIQDEQLPNLFLVEL